MIAASSTPRILTLGLLSLVLLSIYGLVEFVLLEQITVSVSALPAIDLLLKLTFLASILAFCLFARELLVADALVDRNPADRDLWTGLMQKPAFEAAVENAIRTEAGGVVMLLSIAGLPKALAGRALRATLQKETGLRLIECAPEGATLSVWSQTEFALLLPRQYAEVAEDHAAKFIEGCCVPVTVGVRKLELNSHAGLISLAPGMFEHAGQALRAAGIALRCAEAAGRSGSVVYDATLKAFAVDRERLIRKLPRAIYDRRLEVYLQPRVVLADERICGFEALARWPFDGRLIEAREIVDVAEHARLLVELDTFMLDEAIRLVADWNRRRKTAFSLSVNLSSVHFLTPSGTHFIRDTLNTHRFPPHLLTIEIAETDLLARKGVLAPALAFLRETGCRLSIDDFGAGQATISDLLSLPADEIKIDGSLVEDLEASPEGQAILRALLQMADRLRIDTVVEGVERHAQAETLLKLGCSGAQGFLFGRPRPALEWLADVTFGQHDMARLGNK